MPVVLLLSLVLAVSLACGPTADARVSRSESPKANVDLPQTGDSLSRAQFVALSARLSDGGAYFDTDNLISNERSLLHPLTELDQRRVRGGAFVGVGPDQGFNYIARTAPRIAFMVDIRRDNLLQHLLYKALFTVSRNRAEHLALWLGRPVPSDVSTRENASIDSLVAWARRTPATAASTASAVALVRGQVSGFGMTLSAEDLATIERFHRAFIAEGVALRFTSHGRAPQPYYPTLAQLLTERDLSGAQSGYMASEAAFRVVQSLERRNLVVPVVSDLAGPKGLPSLATVLRERGDSLSVFYTSNVEDYLIRDGRFPTFVQSLAKLPRTSNAVIIRSWFGGAGSHSRSVPGYHTTQLVEPIADLVSDPSISSVRSYRQLVMRLR
ncbi:MAG TPA: hypothetical protein VGE27_17360 [Gemmatimonas sp.]|uniref:LIC_10091 family protein n=1 Tax=Gemmatimonas sp. TaxID=1962908 RepID=UPI002EDBA867